MDICVLSLTLTILLGSMEFIMTGASTQQQVPYRWNLTPKSSTPRWKWFGRCVQNVLTISLVRKWHAILWFKKEFIQCVLERAGEGEARSVDSAHVSYIPHIFSKHFLKCTLYCTSWLEYKDTWQWRNFWIHPQLVEGRRDEIPLDSLDEVEKCTLHWMVSYAVNKTLRIDEVEFFTENQYHQGPGRLIVLHVFPFVNSGPFLCLRGY